MSIAKTRGLLYLIARLLGDVNAVQRGTVGKRVARRMAGKASGRDLGKLFAEGTASRRVSRALAMLSRPGVSARPLWTEGDEHMWGSAANEAVSVCVGSGRSPAVELWAVARQRPSDVRHPGCRCRSGCAVEEDFRLPVAVRL